MFSESHPQISSRDLLPVLLRIASHVSCLRNPLRFPASANLVDKLRSLPASNPGTSFRARRNECFRRDHETQKSPAPLLWKLLTEEKRALRVQLRRGSILSAAVQPRTPAR